MLKATPLSPDLTHEERLIAIREAYNEDRSQMTLMLAHQLRVPEVDVIRALEGDTAHELDFSCWEEIIYAFEALGEVTVIVSNGSTTIESFGQFGGFNNAQAFSTSAANRSTCTSAAGSWHPLLPSANPAISTNTNRFPSNSSTSAATPPSRSSSTSAAKTLRLSW